MKVVAIQEGYYGNVRVRAGTEFEMDDKIAHAKKDEDGNPTLPKWVEAVDAQSARPDKKKISLPGVKIKHHEKSSKSYFGKASSSSEDDVI